MANVQQQVLVAIGPFQGLDAWSSPWYTDDSVLTDVSFLAFDESLGAVVTAKRRENLVTGLQNPLGLDVFYRSGTGQPYAIVVAGGVWKLVDYISNAAPVDITLPSTWDASAQTYFVLAGSSLGKTVLLAFNGISTPLKMLDDFDPAAPAATKAGLKAPTGKVTAAAGGTGNLNGTYRWRVTFESSSHESDPGPIGDPLTVTNQSVNLSNIPTASDPTVQRRHVWRLGGSVPEWRHVGTINDNTTTTATDNVSDLDLGRLLSFDRGAPPSGITVAVHHKGRVFGFIKDDLVFSNFDEPEGWNPTNTIPIGRGDDIVTLGTTGSVLLIFKRNQTWALFGETLEDFVALKIYDIGCVGPRAVVSAPGEVYWLAEDGFRRSDGRNPPELIGAQIYPIVRDLPAAAKKTCNMAYGAGKVWASFPDATPPVTFVYDLKTRRWEKYPFGSRQVVGLFSAVSGDPGFFAFTEYTTAPAFNVRRWPGTSYGDLGGNTSWYLERAYLHSQSGKAIKVYRELEIIAPRQPGITVTVTLTVEDDVNKQQVIAVPLDNGPVRVGLRPELRGTYLRLRVEGSHSSRVEIQGIRVHGWIERLYGRDVGGA